jgi:diguanylate cyclase (GGDEF)-like protein
MSKRRRVVLVEPEGGEVQQELRALLSQAGYEVVSVPDEATAQALSSVEAIVTPQNSVLEESRQGTLQRAQGFVKNALWRAGLGLARWVKPPTSGPLAPLARRLSEGPRTNDDLRQKNRELEHLTQELRRANAELLRLAVTDALTGMNNRRHFMEGLRREFQRANRYQRPLSLLLLDIDHFKQINDTHGHPVGDAVLTGFARLLTGSIRATDLAARLGGEEFAIAFVESDLTRAFSAAEALREKIARECFEYHGMTVRITVSGGLVDTQHKSVSSHLDLIELADRALYQAKTSGRNRIVPAVVPEV